MHLIWRNSFTNYQDCYDQIQNVVEHICNIHVVLCLCWQHDNKQAYKVKVKIEPECLLSLEEFKDIIDLHV